MLQDIFGVLGFGWGSVCPGRICNLNCRLWSHNPALIGYKLCIFKRLWYDWTQQQPGIGPTNPLGQCWVPPIVAFYDQQGLLRTYSLPGSSIRSPHPGSPRGRLKCHSGMGRYLIKWRAHQGGLFVCLWDWYSR